ncbi:MAG: bifunctional nuclease family protein [Anaerolineae bacterium]|nr:MAG: bifunctional nuclease family protein [Anaerolineae bacterium]
MSDMVEVVIDSIRVSLLNQQRIIVLRQVDEERYLAIWVGVFEAEHLNVALQDVELARPLTYELFSNVLASLNAELLRVEVVALRNETFYGNLVLRVNGHILNIDSRPSDAINLAVRNRAPIYVAREVMDSAGIRPGDDDVDLQEEAAGGEAGLEEDDRLSIFEDFLEKLEEQDDEDEGEQED